MRLEGKTAFISGGGRNIGRAIALKFASEGANVVLVSRTDAEVKEVAKECETIGVTALPLQADVGNPQDVNNAAQRAIERFGGVDILACVAGVRPAKPIVEYSYDEWHQVFSVNLHSTFYLAKALIPGMIARKSGNIIALGGMASLTALSPSAAIVASKHGLYGLIKCLALEHGPNGIRANLIAVGSIDTERRNPEWYAHSGGVPLPVTDTKGTPLRRLGSPDEVANVALFLASAESSYVTGDCIICAGGRYL